MTEADLNVLLDLRSENEHVEFKEAKNNFHFEKLVDYCVALANEGGGRMVLGVTDKPPRRVVGTSAFETPEKTVAGIYERIHLKVLWHEIRHAEGRVLVFEVPSEFEPVLTDFVTSTVSPPLRINRSRSSLQETENHWRRRQFASIVGIRLVVPFFRSSIL